MEFTNPLPFRHQREPHLPKPLQILSANSTLEPSRAENDLDSHPPFNLYPPSVSSRPRSPLPPHKLAKIANALGVNTPLPAAYRSPSPSGSPTFRMPSRYLLHVVPPNFLPLDDDDDGSDPEGKSFVSASGYRTQFRRGTLIPLYPSLQSQLGAIAREYNMPSTGGLVLYLMHSSHGITPDGPRISDDIWKLLWHKALQAERKDSQTHTGPPLEFRSGRSTPNSNLDVHDRGRSPSQSASVRTPLSPFPYPSPATSSAPSSEVNLPLFNQQRPPSPDPLADLTPNPFLPILAKVEFDVDRRKAPWYDAWAHGRRTRTRWRGGGEGGKITLTLPQRAQSRDRLRADFLQHNEEASEYALLDDGEGEQTAVDDDEHDEGTIVQHQVDPLADVFGNDDMTWRELQAGRSPKPKAGRGLGVAASQPEIIIPPEDEEKKDEGINEERDTEEVVKLWNDNRRPTLPLESPDLRRKPVPAPLNLAVSTNSLSTLSSGTREQSSLPYLKPMSPSESESSKSGGIKSGKKGRRRTGMIFGDLEVKIVAEPEQMTEEELAGERSSQLEMKHKLDQLEKQLAELSPRKFDALHPLLPQGAPYEGDWPPRSAPPGVNQFTIRPQHKVTTSFNSSPRKHASSLKSGSASIDALPVPPRKDSLLTSNHPQRPKEHKRSQGSQSSSGSSSKNLAEPASSGVARPPMTYGSLSKPQPPIPSSPPGSRSNIRPWDRSTTQLALKRATDSRKPGDIPEEVSSPELNGGQDVSFPAHPPRSPGFPLSPDPFGKQQVEDLRQPRRSGESNRSVASSARPPSAARGAVLPPSVPEGSETDTQSSRFSLDSEHATETFPRQRRSRSGSIVSVRSLRNLWRKSGSSGKTQAPAAAAAGGPLPPLPSSPSTSSIPIQSLDRVAQANGTESTANQWNMRTAADRRRPSAATRPDSGSDPFQFDNTNIYKSPSSASLVGSIASMSANSAAAGGSIGKSKGILKGWNSNQPDGETRFPSLAKLRRSLSTTSAASLSEQGDREGSSDTLFSPPSTTPSDPRRELARYMHKPSASPEPVMMLSHSLPTSTTIGELSRYPEGLPAPGLLSYADGGLTPRLAEFELPPSRRPPGLSQFVPYTGEISS